MGGAGGSGVGGCCRLPAVLLQRPRVGPPPLYGAVPQRPTDLLGNFNGLWLALQLWFLQKNQVQPLLFRYLCLAGMGDVTGVFEEDFQVTQEHLRLAPQVVEAENLGAGETLALLKNPAVEAYGIVFLAPVVEEQAGEDVALGTLHHQGVAQEEGGSLLLCAGRGQQEGGLFVLAVQASANFLG